MGTTITVAADPKYYPFGTVLTSPLFPGYNFVVQDIGPAVTGVSHFDIASSGAMFPFDYARFSVQSLGDPNSAAMQRYFADHGGSYVGPPSDVTARTTTYFPGQGGQEGGFETYSGATPSVYDPKLPPDTNPFQYSPPSDISLPSEPIDLANFLPPPNWNGTPASWESGWQPNSALNPPSDSAQRPGFIDLSSATPPGSFPNFNPPTNEFMQPSSPDQWSQQGLFNPPTNESMMPSSLDQWSPAQNVPTNENMMPDLVNQWSVPDLFNPPTNENMMPSPVDQWSDQISSPGEVTDNPFADPSWSAPSEQTPGTITDNPFADPSWLPGQPSPQSTDQAPVYDPLSQGSTGQPGGIPTVQGTIIGDNGMYYRFDPTTGTYQPTGVMATSSSGISGINSAFGLGASLPGVNGMPSRGFTGMSFGPGMFGNLNSPSMGGLGFAGENPGNFASVAGEDVGGRGGGQYSTASETLTDAGLASLRAALAAGYTPQVVGTPGYKPDYWAKRIKWDKAFGPSDPNPHRSYSTWDPAYLASLGLTPPSNVIPLPTIPTTLAPSDAAALLPPVLSVG